MKTENKDLFTDTSNRESQYIEFSELTFYSLLRKKFLILRWAEEGEEHNQFPHNPQFLQLMEGDGKEDEASYEYIIEAEYSLNDLRRLVTQIEKIQKVKPKEIVITVEGGNISSVDGISKGVKVKVMDFDTEGTPDDDERLSINKKGERYFEAIYA